MNRTPGGRELLELWLMHITIADKGASPAAFVIDILYIASKSLEAAWNRHNYRQVPIIFVRISPVPSYNDEASVG